MSCIEIKSDKYQNRKSPPFHAKDCKEMIKKGKDGNYKSLKDKNDIYKWIKVKPSSDAIKQIKDDSSILIGTKTDTFYVREDVIKLNKN